MAVKVVLLRKDSTMIDVANLMGNKLNNIEQFRADVKKHDVNKPMGRGLDSNECVLSRWLRHVYSGIEVEYVRIENQRLIVKRPLQTAQVFDSSEDTWYNKFIRKLDAVGGGMGSYVYRSTVEIVLDSMYITPETIMNQLTREKMFDWARGLDGFAVIAKARMAGACPISVFLKDTLPAMSDYGVFQTGLITTGYRISLPPRPVDFNIMDEVFLPSMPYWASNFVTKIDNLGVSGIKRDEIINVLYQV